MEYSMLLLGLGKNPNLTNSKGLEVFIHKWPIAKDYNDIALHGYRDRL